MTDLRNALHDEAERLVPHPDIADVMRRVERRRRTARRVRMGVAAGVAAVWVAGAAVVWNHDDVHQSISPATTPEPTAGSVVAPIAAPTSTSLRPTIDAPPGPVGNLSAIALAVDADVTIGALDRHDSTALDGPWSVVVRGAKGSLGSNSAVVTFPVSLGALPTSVRVGGVQGYGGDGQVVWPIAGSYARVRGDLGAPILTTIATATSIVGGRPTVAPLDGFTIEDPVPYRSPSVHELRYGSADVGQEAALGNGLTYTGLQVGATFEDELFQTIVRHGYTVQGHPAVISAVGGGNATIAWEPSPGIVAYVGYSGASLDDDAANALVELASASAPIANGQWELMHAQVVEQTNGSVDASVTSPQAHDVGCATTADQPVGSEPQWAIDGGGLPPSDFVRGVDDNVLVYSFARPLLVTTGPDGPKNKVLFITRRSADSLQIIVSLDGNSVDDSHREVGAGRSFPVELNVPSAGCWRIDITAGDVTDTVYLLYV